MVLQYFARSLGTQTQEKLPRNLLQEALLADLLLAWLNGCACDHGEGVQEKIRAKKTGQEPPMTGWAVVSLARPFQH